MSAQPKALVLANSLLNGEPYNVAPQAATELHRLHALNAELLAALRGMVCLYEVMHARNPYTDSRPLQALAAITKAEGNA